MKLCRKYLTIFVFIIMIFNVVIMPINVLAEALNFNDSYSEIESSISDINDKYNNYKTNNDYYDDLSYKYALDKLYESYSDKVEKYNNSKLSAGEYISLKTLLTISGNTSLIEQLEEKGISDVNVFLNNIEDITYFDDSSSSEVILISKEDLYQIIYNTYFSDFDSYFSNLNSSFNTYVENNKDFYNEMNNKYLSTQGIINNYISLINSYISTEESIGNIVDVNISSKSVIDLLNDCLDESYSLLETVLNNGVYNNEFDDVESKAGDLYNEFLDNNKYYTEELLLELEELVLKYTNFESDLKTLFNDNGIDYSNIDYSLIKSLDSVVIKEFIQYFEDSLVLDSNYVELINKINNYLSLKVSESDKFTNLLDSLNVYYSSFGKDNIYSLYSNFVYNANLLSEDIVNSLLNYSALQSESAEYKYLMEAKCSFYPLELKDDSNFNGTVVDDYFVINGSNIKILDFINNINYGYKFDVKCNLDIVNSECKINLFDRDDKFVREILVVLKNDIDNNGIVDNLDIEKLKDKLFDNIFTYYDVVVSDLNNDEKVDIRDLVLLDNLVNNKESSVITEKGSFDVKINETNDKIIYKVYLKTDGVVRGFKFNIENNNGLKLSSIINGEGVSYKSYENYLALLGLGEYVNDSLVVTLEFDKLSDAQDYEIDFNGSIILDNLEYVSNITLSNVIPKVVSSSEDIVVNTQNTVNTRESMTSSEVEVVENDDEDDNKIESAISGEDFEEDEAILGNIIKIALIVLIGALIIYLLNNKEEENVSLDEDNKNQK